MRYVVRGSGCVCGNDFVRVTIGLNGVYSSWESEEKLCYVIDLRNALEMGQLLGTQSGGGGWDRVGIRLLK